MTEPNILTLCMVAGFIGLGIAVISTSPDGHHPDRPRGQAFGGGVMLTALIIAVIILGVGHVRWVS